MKRFQKIYLEITNICNLKCTFCPGTKRSPEFMQEERFRRILEHLQPWADYLYFHLMGEPLLHPQLSTYLRLAGEHGFRVILTTNGTLLRKQKSSLLSSPALHKLNISLHAFEANDLEVSFDRYLADCIAFGKEAEGKIIVVYRLWNAGGADFQNSAILEKLSAAFPGPWQVERRGIRIAEKVYLEHGNKFDWPDMNAQEGCAQVFCYGLRDQLGILCDGTVVPCCLDHEGDIPLGNILTQPLDEILQSPRAKALYDGFSHRSAAEVLCRKCGYARRFQ